MLTMFVDDAVLAKHWGTLKQNAARLRRLRALGIPAFPRPNRTVFVLQAGYDRWLNPAPAPDPTPPAEAWAPPAQLPWEETPLGKMQQRERESRHAAAVERERYRQEHAEEIEAACQERIAQAREHKAGVIRHHAAKRRTLKLQRTPAWADMDAIKAIYIEARRLSTATGIPHHVDHDVPLQGRLASGLHVHQNLQILTGSENSRKSNRFEVSP